MRYLISNIYRKILLGAIHKLRCSKGGGGFEICYYAVSWGKRKGVLKFATMLFHGGRGEGGSEI